MITINRLSSGYWHIRGTGPCEWAQTAVLPTTFEAVRAAAFPEASDKFCREAARACEAAERPISTGRVEA